MSEFMPFITGLPGLFSTRLPWQAELALLIVIAVLLETPHIIRSFPLRKPRRKNRRRPVKHHS